MYPSSSCSEKGFASSERRADVVCGFRDLGIRERRSCVCEGGSRGREGRLGSLFERGVGGDGDWRGWLGILAVVGEWEVGFSVCGRGLGASGAYASCCEEFMQQSIEKKLGGFLFLLRVSVLDGFSASCGSASSGP